MVDVFISYARANRDMVRRLAEAIGRLGYVVWWDEELPAHLSYGTVITEKIGEAKATLVVWSAVSAASESVRAEADMARNQKTLIQTAIGDCVPPLPFNRIQYAEIGDWHGEEDHPGWRKARASLAALCGPAPAETSPPAPAPSAAPPLAAMVAPPVHPARAPAPRPRVARLAPGRANRIALVTIAASVMTILTVGGLVLVKGPPTAHAAESAAPAPASAPAAESAKTGVAEAPVHLAVEGETPPENEPPVEPLDPRDDF